MKGQREKSRRTGTPPTARAAAAVADRHEGIEKAALTEALEMLASGGVKGLTIEGVAARTGIAKTTLYRRWRSKEDLALAVLLEMARLATSAEPGVDVRTGLVSYLDAVITILRDTPMGQVMQGLASDLATDPQLAEAFRREVVALRHEHLVGLLQHDIEAGRVRSDLDLPLLQEMLFGPVYYRLLFSGGPLDKDLAGQVVDLVLPAILVGAQREPDE